jgi:hypothetical protein
MKNPGFPNQLKTKYISIFQTKNTIFNTNQVVQTKENRLMILIAKKKTTARKSKSEQLML